MKKKIIHRSIIKNVSGNIEVKWINDGFHGEIYGLHKRKFMLLVFKADKLEDLKKEFCDTIDAYIEKFKK